MKYMKFYRLASYLMPELFLLSTEIHAKTRSTVQQPMHWFNLQSAIIACRQCCQNVFSSLFIIFRQHFSRRCSRCCEYLSIKNILSLFFYFCLAASNLFKTFQPFFSWSHDTDTYHISLDLFEIAEVGRLDFSAILHLSC